MGFKSTKSTVSDFLKSGIFLSIPIHFYDQILHIFSLIKPQNDTKFS